MCSFRLSSLPAPPPRGRSALTFLCWPSSFQRTLANSPRILAPRSSRLRVQKYYIFTYLQQLFSLFFEFLCFMLIISEINSPFFQKLSHRSRFFAENAAPEGFPKADFAPVLSEFFTVLARCQTEIAPLPRPHRRPEAEKAGPSSSLSGITPYYICVRTGCLPGRCHERLRRTWCRCSGLQTTRK